MTPATKGANIYFGHAGIFLIIWIGLFWFLPDSSEWKTQNQPHFWSVATFLFLAMFLAWTRIARAMNLAQLILPFVVNRILKTDPQMKITEEDRDDRLPEIQERLHELERDLQVTTTPPSLLNIIFRDHVEKDANDDLDDDEEDPREGFPFRRLYSAGEKFEGEHSKVKKGWMKGYLAYTYYSIHKSVRAKVKRLKNLLRFVIFGA